MQEILTECRQNGWSFREYVNVHEDHTIQDFLLNIWSEMEGSIHRGLEAQGVLPGG